jgi:hypothetical protein
MPCLLFRLKLIPRPFEAPVHLLELLAIDSRAVAGEMEIVRDVLDQMGSDPLRDLRLAARHAADRREHERGSIEHGAKGADPRDVVVARTEVAEERVRHVTVEHFGGPSLPLREERRQLVDHVEAGVRLEQRRGRRRRLGACREGHDEDLASLV